MSRPPQPGSAARVPARICGRRSLPGVPSSALPRAPVAHPSKETGMPPTADRHATPAPAATAVRAPRRRRAVEPNPFADALQRALDRRDNGGAAERF